MERKNAGAAVFAGAASSALLLAAYFTVITLISGWNFAWQQFGGYWYYIASLALGFGVQVGLYRYLKTCVSQNPPAGKMLAVTGTTSTAAMISCCAHYLVNILPILGATGIATIASQYQIQLFWVGLAFNLAGIVLIASRVQIKTTMNPVRSYAR